MEGDDKRAEGTGDKVKGKLQEAGGDLTDNEDLKTKGKANEAKGGAKDLAGRAQNAVDDLTS
jgi:uncharacterized protein YjbJ (UPF0337 family)